MDRSRTHQAGFTLVELLIVVIIVGILAAVAIPLYRGATKGAYMTEADAALGIIQRTMRAVTISSSGAGDWSVIASKYTAGLNLKVSDIRELNLDPTDLNGRYFDNNCYRMTVLTATTYTVKAIGDSSATANKAAVAGLIRQIDQEGNLSSP